MKRTYYLAYGMNTNLRSMKLRCPDAYSLGKVKLQDHCLQFKYFCDAELKPGSSMECALWSITDQCERKLDRVEGYPDFYQKKEVTVKYNNKNIRAMIYYMPPGNDLGMPNDQYFDTVCRGYRDHDMNLDSIQKALDNVLKDDQNVHSMGQIYS